MKQCTYQCYSRAGEGRRRGEDFDPNGKFYVKPNKPWVKFQIQRDLEPRDWPNKCLIYNINTPGLGILAAHDNNLYEQSFRWCINARSMKRTQTHEYVIVCNKFLKNQGKGISIQTNDTEESDGL